MSELDLIPADYARQQLLRRRLRSCIAALLGVVCVVALARSTLELLIAIEKRHVSRLEAQRQTWEQNKAKTEEYARQASLMEKQLAALDELRARNRLRLFLEALDEAHVEHVWFDEVKYYRHEAPPRLAEASARATNLPQNAVLTPARGVEQRVAMTGHAINHVTLAEFMKKLERQPAIADVSLIDTSPRRYPNALLIDLKLTLVVDEKPRRQQ